MMNGSAIVRHSGALALLVVFSFATSPALVAGPAPHAAGPVKVTVKYTGAGTVDDTHRLWIWLFDTPSIGAGSIPVAEISTDKNEGTATFETVSAEQVWIAVAYDVGGNFGGSAPPPSGSPVAIYGTESGSPTAVTPGDKAAVTITFNDQRKMP